MINNELFQDYLNSLGLPMEVFLNIFPEEKDYTVNADDPQDVIAFSLKTTYNVRGIEHANLRCLIRAVHPKDCMYCGTQLIKALHMKTNVTIGDVQIVVFKAIDLQPVALGVDNNGNHIYQVDVKVVAAK